MSEYLATPENSPERSNLEMRYGKTTVMRLLAQHEEQKATESWITESTSVCPGCRSHVQKSEGCNHVSDRYCLSGPSCVHDERGLKIAIQMTCTRCTNHFCYRCGAQLKPKEPYAHFQIPDTYCFQKLFATDEEHHNEDFEEYEVDDDPPGFAIFD